MNASSAAPGERGNVDMRFCRFCRKPETETQALFHPCHCQSRSTKFTHQNCLKKAIRSTNNANCTECGHKFDFNIVYSEQHSYIDMGQLMIATAKKAIPLILFALATLIYVIGSIAVWAITIPHHFGRDDLVEGILVFLSFVTTIRAVFHVLEVDLPQWLSFQAFCNLTKVEPQGYGPILFKTEQFAPILDWQRLSVRILKLLKLCLIQAGLFVVAAPVSAAVTRFFVVKLPKETFAFGQNSTYYDSSAFILLAVDEFVGHVALFTVLLVVTWIVRQPNEKIAVWKLGLRSIKVVFCFLFIPWWTGFTISALLASYQHDVKMFESGLMRFYSHAIVGYVYYWFELKLYKYCVTKITERDAIDVRTDVDDAIFKPDIGSTVELFTVTLTMTVVPLITFLLPCAYRHVIVRQIYSTPGQAPGEEEDMILRNWTTTGLVITVLSLIYISPIFDYACIIVRAVTNLGCFDSQPLRLVNIVGYVCFVHCTGLMFGILWTVPEIAIRWFFDSSVVPSLGKGYLIFMFVLALHSLMHAKFFYDRYKKDITNCLKLSAIIACTVIFIPTQFYFYFRVVFHRETVPRFPNLDDLLFSWYTGIFAWIALATNSLTFEKSVFVQLKQDFTSRSTNFSGFIRNLRQITGFVSGILILTYAIENIIAPIFENGGFHSSYHHPIFWICLFIYFYIVPCARQCYEFALQKNRQIISVAPKNIYNEV